MRGHIRVSQRMVPFTKTSITRFLLLSLVFFLCLADVWGHKNTPETSKSNATDSAEEGYSKPECHDCGLDCTTRLPEDSLTLSPSDGGSNQQNETDDFLDDDGIDLYYHRWGGIDILVAVFFVVAAGWLLMAIMYSAIVLVLLRLQARGELDFYDENFGLWVCCNGRIRLHFGCILRRYAIQLEREQQQRRPENGDDDQQHDRLRQVRIMTRTERRCALEKILDATTAASTVHKQHGKGTEQAGGDAHSDSSDVPVCTVCLAEYETGDEIFSANTCSHVFHKECIMDWLERRQNTDCPCCRQQIVSDDEVWEIVKQTRKARRKQLQRENGILHRTIRWVLGNNKNKDSGDMDDDLQQHETSQSAQRSPIVSADPSIFGSTDIESGSASGDNEDDDDNDSTDISAQTPANEPDFGMENNGARGNSAQRAALGSDGAIRDTNEQFGVCKDPNSDGTDAACLESSQDESTRSFSEQMRTETTNPDESRNSESGGCTENHLFCHVRQGDNDLGNLDQDTTQEP